jgi:hypothetical protein
MFLQRVMLQKVYIYMQYEGAFVMKRTASYNILGRIFRFKYVNIIKQTPGWDK